MHFYEPHDMLMYTESITELSLQYIAYYDLINCMFTLYDHFYQRVKHSLVYTVVLDTWVKPISLNVQLHKESSRL